MQKPTHSAWGTNEYQPSPHDNTKQAVMESEITVTPSDAEPRPDTRVAWDGEKQGGVGGKVKKGLRRMWATKMTEDVSNNPDLKVTTTLRELIVYLVFICILCIVTFGMTSKIMFTYTRAMRELFIDTPFENGNTFRGMTNMLDFWKFAKGPLVDGLHWEKWYNGLDKNKTDFILNENKLLGVPRLRQLKMRNDSCKVHDDFAEEIGFCYDGYRKSMEDKQPFGPSLTGNNGTAWNYQSEKELDGSGHWGLMATYSGAGYVQNLASSSKIASLAILEDLYQNLWIDMGTRAVFVDFTVYNANVNLFCVVRLLVEFPSTGGAFPTWDFRTVKLIRYVTPVDFFILACEIIFVLFIFYYIVEETIEIHRHRCAYFKSFWNVMDIVVIVMALCCVAFNVYRYITVQKLLDDLLQQPDQYVDFEFLSFWQVVFNTGVGILLFVAWMKVFKYIGFNKTMNQLSATLGSCAKDLIGFGLMFFIIFLAFAQLGYIIFGSQVEDFSTFMDANFTLLRIILGDFEFAYLEEANRIMGPIYFLLYVFFVFFVLFNMFLAIINDTYSEVKADLRKEKNEVEMGDYFKKSYNKMLTKLNVKRDRVVDIQAALKSADTNTDQKVDFDEWSHELKSRGYSTMEIEMMFVKYDIDGDRILDEEEQKMMRADLDAERFALDTTLDRESHIQGMDERRPSTSHRNQTAAGPPQKLSPSRAGADPTMPAPLPNGGVSAEEFAGLSRRVDRMEESIGSIVNKIDGVLSKMETMEHEQAERREKMSRVLDGIVESPVPPANKKKMNDIQTPPPQQDRAPEASTSGTSRGPGGSRSATRPASNAVAPKGNEDGHE